MRKLLLFTLCALFIGTQATKAQDVIYTISAMNDGGTAIRLDSIRIDNRTNPSASLLFNELPDSDVVRINLSQGIVETEPTNVPTNFAPENLFSLLQNTAGTLIVGYNGENSENVLIRIYSTIGQQLYTSTVPIDTRNSLQISLPKNNMYLVSLQTQGAGATTFRALGSMRNFGFDIQTIGQNENQTRTFSRTTQASGFTAGDELYVLGFRNNFVITPVRRIFGGDENIVLLATNVPACGSGGIPRLMRIGNNYYLTHEFMTNGVMRCWMVENLREELPDVSRNDLAGISSSAVPRYWTIYPNWFSEQRGFYYNWYASTMACPDGWKLPTPFEFDGLINTVLAMPFNQNDPTNPRRFWHDDNARAGVRFNNHTYGTWDGSGMGLWWSNVGGQALFTDFPSFFGRFVSNDITPGFSVRCVAENTDLISVTDVTLNKTTTTLTVGETETLIATITPTNATHQNVSWSSSNTSVATVVNGVVTAVSAGTVTITVTTDDGGKTANCVVTVNEPIISVTGVTLNKATTTLTVGETETLIVFVSPENATNQNVTWSSSNSAIATVVNGVVTAISAGTATITATTEDGNFTATCVVTVNAPIVLVTGITLNRTTTQILIGGTETLSATVIPVNATNRNVTWTSSNPAIATVSTIGVVTAVTAGVTIITATTECGARTASTTVTVSELNSSLDGVVINDIRWATRNVDMPGAFTENPESAGMFYQWNRRVGWSSANPMINSNGGTSWSSFPSAGANWTRANDPCPIGWRVPTRAELESLRNAGNVWITVNGVNGRLFGTTPNQIFLPAAGYRTHNNGALNNVGTSGVYWSSTQTGAIIATYFTFNSAVNNFIGSDRAFGFSVRCVAE